MKKFKTYYAFTRNGMERLDSCIAFTRLGAAGHFANKKHIPIKIWLNTYCVFDYKDFDNLYGKNVYFQKNNITLIQYKVCTLDLHVSRRCNYTDIEAPRHMTRNKFLMYMDYMKKEGFDIKIEITWY